jgi:hypothetical protein
MPMKTRYRLIHRGERGGLFHCVDSETGKRWSLKTRDRDAAEQIVLARNQALRQPTLNLQIAKAYLAGSDSGGNTRTWLDALEVLMGMKVGANEHRWRTVAKDKALPARASTVRIRPAWVSPPAGRSHRQGRAHQRPAG